MSFLRLDCHVAPVAAIVMNFPEYLHCQKSYPSEQPSRRVEKAERARSIYSLLLSAEQLTFAGRAPFGDAEAMYITTEYFIPTAMTWIKQAGKRDGKQRVDLEPAEDSAAEGAPSAFTQLSALLEDRCLGECVHRCWEWFMAPAGSNDQAPWQTILSGAKRQPPQNQDGHVAGEICKGADRHLGHELLRGEARQTLKAAIAKVLKDEGCVCLPADGPRGPRHHHPAGKTAYMPDAGLDLSVVAKKLGRRSPAGGAHQVTHAILPPLKTLRTFCADAFAHAHCALTIGQLLDLCVTVFNLDLRDPLYLSAEPDHASQDEYTRGALAVAPGSVVEPLFWKEKVYDASAEREPLVVIEDFARKLIRQLERCDRVQVDVPIGARERKDWLGPLYLRFGLWFKWPLWDEQSHEPIHGENGKPLAYGYEAAGEHLGRSSGAVQEAIMGRGKSPGRFAVLFSATLEELPEVEIERLEDLLRCRYFHFKPAFVDPANFDPIATLTYLQ